MPHDVGGNVDRIPNERTGAARWSADGTDADGCTHDELLASARSRRRACEGRQSRDGRPAQARRLVQEMCCRPYRRPLVNGPRYPAAVPALSDGAVPTSPLRIAVARADRLAHAAAPLRAVGAVRLAAHRGARRRRARRDAVRHRRLGDHGHAAHARRRTGWSEDAVDRPEGRRVPAHRRRCSSGPTSSTSSTTASTSCRSPTAGSSTPRWSRRSTGSRRRGSSPSTSATTPRPPTWRSATPIATRALHYAATIHHGIDTDAFAVDPDARRAPAVLRADPSRTRARHTRSRSPGGPVADSSSPASSRTSATSTTQVAPHLDGDRVRYLGPGRPPRTDPPCSAAAHALLHLIDFDEPFGYSVVEAMACGTPVIAYARGSMAELVDDGVTGFLVADVDERGRRGRPGRSPRSSGDPSRRTRPIRPGGDGRRVRRRVSDTSGVGRLIRRPQTVSAIVV